MAADLPQTAVSLSNVKPNLHAVSSARDGLKLVRAAHAPSALGPSPAGITKRRKQPKPKPGRQLVRSLSTPQLQPPSMPESDDKKRNKLGYQRISIACGKPFQPSPALSRSLFDMYHALCHMRHPFAQTTRR